jgi:pimeloyl-ACP methyl ester carboxylesterase
MTSTMERLDARRGQVQTASGPASYVDTGGPGRTALFVHGLGTSSYLWRHVIEQLDGQRRCVAVDLPLHGRTPAAADQDFSLPGLARFVADFCDALELTDVDLVANDTGGAVAQVFAARHPERVRTFTLTNCDVHENFPPEAFKPQVELAKQGELGPLVDAMAADLSLARSEVGLGMVYEHPEKLADDLLESYLGPFAADGGKGLERFLSTMDAAELMSVEPLLAELRAPTQVVWGTADVFFEPFWAERLRTMIPGVERVTEIEGAMLFFPDERSDEFVPLLRSFWSEHA